MLKRLLIAALLFPASALSADLREAKSPGGLAFFHQPMPNAPQSALAFAWKRGTSLAIAGKEAAPSLASQMMMIGRKGMSEGEFSELLRDLQAGGGISSSLTMTTGMISAPEKYFLEAVAEMAPSFAAPSFSERTFARARKNSADGIRAQLLKPDSLAQAIANRALAGNAAAVRARTAEAVEAIASADLEDWRKRILSRDEVVIVAAGGLSEAAYGEAIDKALGSLPNLGPSPLPPESIRAIKPITIVMEANVAQTGLVLAGQTGFRTGLRQTLGNLANQTLGGGFETRLTKAVRQELGAAYGIGSFIDFSLGEPGTLMIRSALDTGKAQAAVALAKSEYAKWHSGGVSQAELDAARGIALQQYQQSTRNAAGIASQIASSMARGLSLKDSIGFEDRINAITFADVNEAITKSFPGALLAIIVTPSADGFGGDCVIHKLEEVDACMAK